MKSYFRFLSRHRLFTFINIVGLCLSMAFLLLLGDLIYRQTTVENYQTRADRTFVVGNEMCMMSNFRVGERLKERFPEVEDWCSIAGYGMTFNIGGQKADTKVLVTGQNFFTFFDYCLLTGDRRKVLSAPNQIVVSKSFAQRYWPDESPIGKEMVLGDDEMELGDANGGKGHITYTVSGIMDDFDRSIIPDGYECVFNVENLRHFHYSAWNEQMNNAACCVLFLMQREGCDLRSKTGDMIDYLKTFFWLYQMEAAKELTLTPFSTIYYDAMECSLGQEDINHGSAVEGDGHPSAVGPVAPAGLWQADRREHPLYCHCFRCWLCDSTRPSGQGDGDGQLSAGFTEGYGLWHYCCLRDGRHPRGLAGWFRACHDIERLPAYRHRARHVPAPCPPAVEPRADGDSGGLCYCHADHHALAGQQHP